LSDELAPSAYVRRVFRRVSTQPHEILVVGLGRFGSALGTELVGLGHRVLGMDMSSELVQRYSTALTQTVTLDSTDADALRQIGAADYDRAVVAIGNDIEASVLTVVALLDVGVPSVWAKAVSEPHARILERVGAHHVVQPERDMGRRTARLVVGRMVEYLALDEGFSLVETVAPKLLVGRTLSEIGVRAKFGVTVVCIKPSNGRFDYATADTVVQEGDLLVVAGPPDRASAFADLDDR
jgi:trk system potassium uptake protein